MVYLKSISGDEPVVTGKENVLTKTSQLNQKKVKVVPVSQKEEKQTEDIDKLPQGYYVEKSQDPPVPEPEPTQAPEQTQTTTPTETATTDQSNDDNNEPDTKIHSDERIEMSESITIANDEVKPITEALDNAVRRGLNSTFGSGTSQDGEVDSISSAESMMKHDTFQPLDMNFKKGLHGSGLGRFEINNFKYEIEETGSKIKWTSNAKRIDLKGTFENKSGNTKLFGYFKGVNTKNNTTLEIPESPAETENTDNEKDIEPIPELSNIKTTYNEYCGYAGLRQKFNNGHVLSATAFHDINERMSSNTTQFDALYDLGIADITGSAAIYKIGNSESSVKTNLSCKFKMFDVPSDKQPQAEKPQDEQSTQNEEAEEHKTQTVKTGNKKWDKKSGLLLEFETEEDPEQGIGYYWDFKKENPNSKTRLTIFGKGSTTQRGKDKKSSYHNTIGANFQYKEEIYPKTFFDLCLDVKNKITAGGEDKGSITTAFGTARLTSKNKFIAELEGRFILAKDTYKALALRFAYKFSPKVEVSAEAASVNQNECGVKLKGYTGLASVHVNL